MESCRLTAARDAAGWLRTRCPSLSVRVSPQGWPRPPDTSAAARRCGKHAPPGQTPPTRPLPGWRRPGLSSRGPQAPDTGLEWQRMRGKEHPRPQESTWSGWRWRTPRLGTGCPVTGAYNPLSSDHCPCLTFGKHATLQDAARLSASTPLTSGPTAEPEHLKTDARGRCEASTRWK